ncbi:MAG: glycosyltransferase, partial [Anaerolineales bacterium]|nr:glycosyltransferase [Anaerolineales bacterium]
MPRLHIVEKYHSFAMQRMSVPLKKLIGIEITFGEEIDESADVNLHMPWHFLTDYELTGKTKHIIVFTHLNRGAEPGLYKTANKADAITVMSFDGRKKLIELGIDPRKIHVAYCGVDHTQYRKRNIGIVASKQPNGRKRGHILLDLAWRMDPNWLQLFSFCIIGLDWDYLVDELKHAGLDINYIPGITNDQEMLNFYHSFDVLLSTGYEEGGPMPLIEAMKSGVKVLTPDYGYAHDLLTNVDKYSTVEDLEKKLIAMFEHDIENARLASMLTWKAYVEEYAMILNDLLGEPIKE